MPVLSTKSIMSRRYASVTPLVLFISPALLLVKLIFAHPKLHHNLRFINLTLPFLS